MRLHQAGKVTNDAKGVFDGVSVTTFALGTSELYAWLDGNDEVAFLPVETVNDPTVIARTPTSSPSTVPSRSTSTARWWPTTSTAGRSRASAGTRTSWPAPSCTSTPTR